MQTYVLIYPALGVLRRTDGVVSAHAAFGPYEIIAPVETQDLDELSDLVARQTQAISERHDYMHPPGRALGPGRPARAGPSLPASKTSCSQGDVL
jgi:hypothetical protein